MNRWVMEAGALLLVGALAAGWHYRASIMALVDPPASAANPAEKPDVLYTWVDDKGVTHFSAQPGKGSHKVELDGSRITPVQPVEPALIASLEQAEADDGRKGGKFIHAMRDDIQQNKDKIQHAKMVAAGLEEEEGQ